MTTPLYTRILYINGRPQPEGGGGGGSPGGGTGLLDWRDSVLDKDLTTPPGGPAVGRFIVAAPAAGLWALHEDEIAVGDGVAAWTFEVPNPGFATYVEDESTPYFYDGVGWSAFTAGPPLSASAPVDVTKAAASAGVSTDAARADHKHNVSTAVAGSILPDDAAAEGTATSLARSDHRHSIAADAPGSIQPDDAASEGVAASFARSDHKHAIAAAAPGTIAIGDAAAEGASTSFARADHSHALPVPAAPADVTKAAASAGAATTVARADHKHDVTTAAAIDLTDSTNAEGTATSLARSDHTHSHGVRGGGTLHAVATVAVAGFMAAADKSKVDGIASEAAPATLLFGAGSVGFTTTTRYMFPGFDSSLAQTSAIRFRVPRAGKIRKMRVHQNVPAGNGLAIVYTLRVEAVATALFVSMASTASEGANNVASVSVSDDDLIDIEITKAASVVTAPSDVMVSLEFAAA